MEHARLVSASVLALDEDAYRDALLDIEHVLVRAAIRRSLFLLAVAVEVEQSDLVERRHQRPELWFVTKPSTPSRVRSMRS